MSENNSALPTGQVAGRQAKRSSIHYAPARVLYVEGEPGATPEDPHQWPTLEIVANRFGMRPDVLRKRAGKEGWTRQRAMFAARLERERRNAKMAKMTAEAAKFDNTSLKLANALLGEVAQGVRDIAKIRQLRDMRAREAEGDDAELLKVLTDGKLRPATANTLAALATALAGAQRIGRLALGETTENTGVDLPGPIEVEIEHKGKVEHDFRTDPKLVAEIARVLKDSGVE